MRKRGGRTPRQPASRSDVRRGPYHHGDLRRALVEAAAALVARRGAAAVTLREVGRRAGVSHAAPYHHFSDKDALMAAVAEEGFRRFDASQARALAEMPAGATTLERLRALGRSYVGFARDNTHFLDVMFRSGEVDARQYPELAALAGGTFQRLFDTVAAVLGSSARTGPRALPGAIFAWCAVHGFASLWLHGRIGPAHGDFDRMVDDLLDHVGRGLAADAR
jgi:AcrR family transcriptional regulator